MKISTKTGDNGQTGLLAGPRVSKDHVRIEACGTVDELNAQLGRARAEGLPEPLDPLLSEIQHRLFDVGAELACPHPQAYGLSTIRPVEIRVLEEQIEHYETQLPPLRDFILPGGTPAAAQLHVARTVCRRAERRIVTLQHVEPEHFSPCVIQYLNRLGDLLFLLARAANHLAGVPDVPWKKETPRASASQ